MRTLKRQSGMSMFGVLIFLGLLSFFLMVTIRLLPTYMEGRSVKETLERVAAGSNKEESLRDINRRILNTFITNRIEVITPKQVKVYRDKGKVIIDANYETRIPLFKGVDAVLMFDDIVLVVD